jgi:hypothetical protein
MSPALTGRRRAVPVAFAVFVAVLAGLLALTAGPAVSWPDAHPVASMRPASTAARIAMTGADLTR